MKFHPTKIKGVYMYEKLLGKYFQGYYSSVFNFSGVASLASSGSLAQFRGKLSALGGTKPACLWYSRKIKQPRLMEKI